MKIIKRAITLVLSASMLISLLPVMNAAAAENTPPSAPTELLTNELTEPMNVETPTFGWLVNDADYNEVQTAYQIIVTDEVTNNTVWDSDKVVSSNQSYVKYDGNELDDGHPYSWKVKTWDKDGAESPYSDNAYFSTGIKNDNWDASWISSGKTGANHYWHARYEKSLDSTKTVASIMAYFAGVHDYELNVNGEYIGRGQSFDYASETRYQGWDITDSVKNSNKIAIGLLNRYYGGGQGRAASKEALLGHINIYYTDGTKDTIVTNGDWKVSTDVPLGGSIKRNGEGDFVEEYNAQNTQEGFSAVGFDDSAWSAASVIGVHPTTEFTNVIPELSKPTDYIVNPVSVTKLSNGVTVADFGKVIPARPQITFKNGTAGKQLTIQTGYVLNTDGTVNSNSRVTQSTNMTYKYTQKNGEQVYSAWDHLGFRYIQIPDCGEDFTKDTITAKVVHTNVPENRDSTFTSSNEMLNNVYELLKRSALYSIQNSFVDTPTREKGQFLQDSINISESSTATLYERAASKKAIEQFLASADRYWTGDEAGRYNSVYPNCDGKRDIPDFSLNVPYWVWNYYMTTGDKATLEKAYPYIKATADYITKYINSSTGLVTQLGGGDGSPNSYQYGIVDWPAVGRFGYDWSGTKTGARTTVNMLSKRAFDVVALAAKELGNTKDAEDMQNRSDSIKTAINEKLITSNGVYCDGLNANGNQVSHTSQHATSYALAFGVAPDDKISTMADYVAAMGMKQGPMTADVLVKSLFSTNKNTAALKLFTEPNDNGWAKEVANDYTFTWEAWDANNSSNENSQSHGWGATAASDILKNFAGVTNLEPGASKVQIAPVYTDLTSLDASVSTERGNIDVSYTRSDKSYDIDITIPANMTADIVLPVIGDGKFIEKNGKADDGTTKTEVQTITVGSGKYSFSYDGNITVLPEKVEYKEPLPEGIFGKVDTNVKTYTWGIGETDIAAENGVTYSDKNDYADLTVSLAKGDSLNEGIFWGASSVRETNTNGQKNLGDTKRYLLVEPKRDGTFSIDIAFSEASDRKKNRVYCADLGLNADTSNIVLSDYSKDSSNKTTVGNDITSTNVTAKTVDMVAGHAYILYTYQTGSTISAMSYTYTGDVVKPSTSPAPTTKPTPTSSVKPSEKPSSNGKYMHISFDDVYACLKDITEKDYNSIFENSFFADLKKLHDDYGAVFTLNCFNAYSKDSSYNISNLPDRYAEEFKTNSDWLKFAFHAENDKATYGTTSATSSGVLATSEQSAASYNKFISAIMKATGNNADSIDTVTRLGFFSGNNDNVSAMQNCEHGITGLLTADDTRLSYYFDNELNDYIIANNDYYDTDKNLRLIRTQTRLESVKDTSSTLDGLMNYSGNVLEIFTHESEYKGSVVNRLKSYVEWAYNNGYDFDYAMNVQGRLIKILNKSTDGNKVDYTLQISAGNGATAIAASYNEDKSLYALQAVDVVDNKANLSVEIPNDNAEVKIMLWDSLSGLEPLSNAVIDKISTNDEESNAITLNYTTYPLVVGNKSKTDFSDWETRGSAVQLVAEVNDSEYTASDITWQSENADIATVTSSGRVQGRTTGYTNIYAVLPNGDKKSCTVSVVDNITRSTVGTLEFNTSSLSLAVGADAELIPIINPKDIYGNGALDTSLKWETSNAAVATVENGKVTAVSTGTATIKAISNDIGRTAECVVTVSENTASAQITADIKPVDIKVGETIQLMAESDSEIIWKSDNSFIADVDENGLVTAYSNSNVPRLIDNPNYKANSDKVTEASEKIVVFDDGAVQYDKGTVKIYATSASGEVKTFEIAVSDADLKPITNDYNSTRTQNNSEEQLNFAGEGYLDNLHIPKETITDNSVNLLWNSSSKMDIPDLAGYKIFVNGKETDTVTTLGYTVNNLSPSTQYSITVQAVDNSGNILQEDSITATTKEKSQVINVLYYGAKGNGKVMDTYAIQKAINACPENGTVYLPRGYIFYSGALFLKSNMTFKVDGILMGSSDSKDYPLTVTRWEGWRKDNQSASEWANTTADLPDNHYSHTSLINAGIYDETDGAYNVGNIVICGNGQINGNGFKLAYNEGLNHKTGNGGIPYQSSPAIDQTIRGRLITIHNAQNVYMKDVQLAYGPSWTVHPIYCDSITFDNLDIVSKGNGETGAADDICILNGDGIDPDSSTNVNIFNTHFYTGDDAVAVKSGRNKEGNELNKPTAFIRITDCVSDGSKGGFAVGSENASGIKNALFQNLTIKNITLSHGIWFKTYWSRGGVSENVIIRDIDSQKPLAFVMNYATSENNPADSVPQYRNFTIENCNSSLSFEGFKAEKGHDGAVISNVTVRGCTKSGTIKYGKNFNIYGADVSKWDVSNSENINIYADRYMEDTLLRLKNGAVKVYQIDNEAKEISIFTGTTSDDVLSEISSLCGGNQTYEFSNTGELSNGNTLTVTSQDGENTAVFVISVVSTEMQVWDFAKYTTEVKTTESGFTEEYDGLTIAIANNGADTDHDKITTDGVYWRGGAPSGNSARYIAFTPDKDGMLYATGKLNSSGGRWGISNSLDVSSFVADSSSTTSTSTATVQMQCTAGTTYYIYSKTRSATVNSVSYMPQ